MKRYLRVKWEGRYYYFNLDLLRDIHNQYLDKLDLQKNHCSWSIPIPKITQYLFEDDLYILDWINNYINWRIFLDLSTISECLWNESEKKIVMHEDDFFNIKPDDRLN